MIPPFFLIPSTVSRIYSSLLFTSAQNIMSSYAARCSKITSPVQIEETLLSFSDTVDHLGILRNSTSNLPNLMNRITALKKAMGAMLHSGIARGHIGNPAASLRVEKLYGAPVLLSGLGALILSKSELDMIDHHHKETAEHLMRLHPRTPQCVVAFLAGSLPGTALFHLRMFSIFGMICRSSDSLLHRHAIHVLISSKPSSKSWFVSLRDLSLQYNLPHPLALLQSPPSKESHKRLVKQHVIDYWEVNLRTKASALLSLTYFHPNYMSLSSPHPIWTTAGPSPYQVCMSTIQAIMLSGRYRTELLCSHWSQNKSGYCIAPSCKSQGKVVYLHHILASFRSLDPTRQKL